MAKQAGEEVTGTIHIRDNSGNAVDSPAETPPTVVLRRNADPATDVAGIVTKEAANATGEYKATATIPSNWAVGDGWELIAHAVNPEGTDDRETIARGYLDGSLAVSVAVTAAVAAAAAQQNTLTVKRGDALRRSWTGLGDISTRTKLWLTAKRKEGDADAAALFSLTESGGLLLLNGAEASDAAAGSIVVDDEAAGDITLYLSQSATALLRLLSGGVFDVQWLGTADTTTPLEGSLAVVADVTQAVS